MSIKKTLKKLFGKKKPGRARRPAGLPDVSNQDALTTLAGTTSSSTQVGDDARSSLDEDSMLGAALSEITSDAGTDLDAPVIEGTWDGSLDFGNDDDLSMFSVTEADSMVEGTWDGSLGFGNDDDLSMFSVTESDSSSEFSDDLWQPAPIPAAPTGKYRDLAQVGDFYKGEHENAQWRALIGEKLAGATHMKTVAYDEEQQAAHRLGVDDDGRLTQGGGLLDTSAGRGGRIDSGEGTFIFAMGRDGDLQAADQMQEIEALRAEHREARGWAAQEEEVLGEALEPEEIEARFGKDVLAKRFVHHSSFFGGEDVAGAGEFQVAEGRLKRVNANSGHYKPGLAHLTNVVHELGERGVDMADTLVDVPVLDETGNAKMDDRRAMITETFHAGEVEAADGGYAQLMAKKAMLAEIRSRA